MNSKLSKLSNEVLEQQLPKLEKKQKTLDVLFIIIIVCVVILFLLTGFKITVTNIGFILFALYFKFLAIPQQIGAIKAEINRRTSTDVNQNENVYNN